MKGLRKEELKCNGGKDNGKDGKDDKIQSPSVFTLFPLEKGMEFNACTIFPYLWKG